MRARHRSQWRTLLTLLNRQRSVCTWTAEKYANNPSALHRIDQRLSLQTRVSGQPVILTFSQHAHLLALSQPTLLAFPAHVHVHFTVSATLAFVHSILCYAPSEETWARSIKRTSDFNTGCTNWTKTFKHRSEVVESNWEQSLKYFIKVHFQGITILSIV